MSFKRVRSSLNTFIKNIEHNNLFNYAAQLSYGLMLAFVPILMLFNVLIRFLSSYSDIQTEVIHFISAYFPTKISSLILSSFYVTDVNQGSVINLIASNIALIIFLIYASLRLVRILSKILTKVIEGKYTVNIVKAWLIAFRNLVFILIVASLIFSTYLEFRHLLNETININYLNLEASLPLQAVNFISYVYLVFTLALLYNWILSKLPAKKLNYLSTIPGTIFTFTGWFALFYLMNFLSKYIKYEGYFQIVSQGFIITASVYMISLILLMGVILNQEINIRNLSNEFSRRY